MKQITITDKENARVNTRGSGYVVSVLIGIIITIVVFILILFWAFKTGFILDADTNTNLCRFQLLVQKVTEAPVSASGVRFDSPFITNCKRRYIHITETRVVNDPPGLFTPARTVPLWEPKDGSLSMVTSYSKLGQPELASFMAESMRRCWVMGLEGKEEVFNDQSVFLRENVCLICDEITVEHTSQGVTSNAPLTSGAWLSNYLASNKIPGNNEAPTYADYLFALTPTQKSWNNWAINVGSDGFFTGGGTLSGSPTCIDEHGIDMNPEIRNGQYATVFFRDFSKFRTGCMATYVVPAAKIRQLCDYVAN